MCLENIGLLPIIRNGGNCRSFLMIKQGNHILSAINWDILMRIRSTIESYISNEITALAIIECILSVLIYFFISVYFHTYEFYYLAILLAPLSMLRTRRSDFQLWGSGYTISLFLTGKRILFKFILLWIVLAPILRITKLIRDTTRHPIEAIKSMPENWLRQALYTDIYFPPEVLPNENKYAKQNPLARRMPTFSEVLRNFKNNRPDNKGIKYIAFHYAIILIFLLPYVPSVIYRITFKSTSIVYMPLVWTSYVIYGHKEQWPYIPKRIIESKLEKTVRRVSMLFFLALLCKMGLLSAGFFLNNIYLEDNIILKEVIMTRPWNFWDTAISINICITFVIFVFSDYAIHLKKSLSENRKIIYNEMISIFLFFRWSIAIAIVFYLFVSVARIVV